MAPGAAGEPHQQLPPPGLDGAAFLLQSGEPAAALARLAELEAPPAGADEWFRHKAIEGRAARLTGAHEVAVTALEALVAEKKLDHHLPSERVRFELALSLEALASSGALPVADADARRRDAVHQLALARKHTKIRNLPEVRVSEARVLAAIEGTNPSAARAAANRAIKALDKVIADYPNCPHIGELKLMRAQAMIRAGKQSEAAERLRSIALQRAGEPEAEAAWSELTALGERERKIKVRPWSRAENMIRAENARQLKNVELSRGLLDEIIDEPSTPPSIRRQAQRSRAWTAYKQKDYRTCANDFRAVYEHAGGIELRDDLIRCLERDAQYEEVVALHLERAGKKGMIGKSELWAAIGVAVRGGLYDKALELLARFDKQYRAYQSERRWLDAWLKMRLGKDAEAIAAFAEVERRVHSKATQAKYFRGKLLLRSQDAEEREEGAGLLRKLAERKALSYYGLQARQRLLDAGLDAGALPQLEPMPDESERLDYEATRALFKGLRAEVSGASEALDRAAALHRIGYLEEARREFRIAADEYITSAYGKRGGYTPRNEDYIAGLGWKSDWSLPKPKPSREARKLYRSGETSERVREQLRTLAGALDEPYRLARLTPSVSYPYQSRWHPRAFRPVLEREADVRGVDPNHLWALMYTESRFRRHVVSSAGARGALQIMPWTGEQLSERLGEEGRFDADTLFDIDTNARLATYYIAELLAKFHG
ncbi:MAG: transglycosylase SLT domain-containing protein, partial [Myxococcales bacterium]|nr:transglycosylase SLT domain-containing protein [Myxococcales bacterium]